MSKKSLIIVESPTKIKTLKKFLGDDYIFDSSLGHVRDLPEREFGIDLENDFEPKYTIMSEKEDVIKRLTKEAKACDTVYLAPDPDREGEAIAWHIMELLPKTTNVKRVSFNSITKDAVQKALKSPRAIDQPLVNAQQTRRMLDRMVGYKISPILNRRIQRGKDASVSAGRVQSVALKLVVDREKEIEAFKPVEYWNLGALFKTPDDDKIFKAALYSVDGKRFEKEPVEGKDITLIPNKDTAEKILGLMKQGPFTVENVDRKEKKRNPVPPFITSTLQQEASRHHGFSSAKTMQVAQSLYEGIDLGNEGAEGLITYMRTDSVRVAPEAIQEARDFILKTYGKEYLPDQGKQYATQKAAQDAHEAIRPADMNMPPEKVEKYLSRDQFMLYKLIWRRFIASQMVPAFYDTVSADITAGKQVILRATGSTLKFSGYLAAYEEKVDDEEKDDESRILPPLSEGMLLHLQEWISEQAFTRPPPRFSEASLVKELEKSGIGRPSTYAAIMNKIQSRDYTIKESGRLKPTELGRVIAEFLEANFQQIMNIGFTAAMEDDLELVAEDKKDWKNLLRDFWTQFMPTLELAEKEAYIPKVMTDIDCPTCGAKLQKIWFKSKYFYGCSRYPDCNYSAQLEQLTFNKEDYAEDFDWEQACPKCGKEMKLRHGKFGAFLGCSTYPECKGLVNIPKKGEVASTPENMPPCPAIDCTGHMVARRSRFGKIFYSCSTYPDCNVIVNDLSQLESKYPDHVRTPYIPKKKPAAAKKGAAAKKTTATKKAAPKKAVKEKKPRAASSMPASKLSADLSNIVGATEMSRTEVTKKLWEYIKEKGLQDTANKRIINPDEKLAKVFGSKEPVDMFKMTKLVSQHIS